MTTYIIHNPLTETLLVVLILLVLLLVLGLFCLMITGNLYLIKVSPSRNIHVDLDEPPLPKLPSRQYNELKKPSTKPKAKAKALPNKTKRAINTKAPKPAPRKRISTPNTPQKRLGS